MRPKWIIWTCVVRIVNALVYHSISRIYNISHTPISSDFLSLINFYYQLISYILKLDQIIQIFLVCVTINTVHISCSIFTLTLFYFSTFQNNWICSGLPLFRLFDDDWLAKWETTHFIDYTRTYQFEQNFSLISDIRYELTPYATVSFLTWKWNYLLNWLFNSRPIFIPIYFFNQTSEYIISSHT